MTIDDTLIREYGSLRSVDQFVKILYRLVAGIWIALRLNRMKPGLSMQLS